MNSKSNYQYFGISGKDTDGFRKFATFLLRNFVRIFYRPQYHHLEYIPQDGGYMVMGNHISLLDPLLVHATIPKYVHWVSKKELFKSKLLKKIFSKLKMIELDRDNIDIAAMKAIRNYIKSDKIVGLFPQGTRVEPEQYLDVLPQAGVSAICTKYNTMILPFYLEGPYRIFRKNHIYFGAPFSLNGNLSFHNKEDKNQTLSNEIMRRVYDIADKEYF